MSQCGYCQGPIPGSGRDFSVQHVQTGSGEHTANSSVDNWRDTILQARRQGAQTLSQLNVVVCRTCILVAVIYTQTFIKRPNLHLLCTGDFRARFNHWSTNFPELTVQYTDTIHTISAYITKTNWKWCLAK